MFPRFKKDFSKSSISDKPLSGGGSSNNFNPSKEKKTISLPLVYGELLFIIAIIVSIGVFGYSFALTSKLKNLSVSIEQQRQEFQPKVIQELSIFNTQVSTLKEILDSRSPYATLIQEAANLVAPQTRYTALSIKEEDNGYTISIQGESASFNAYLQQTAIFERSRSSLARGEISDFRIQNATPTKPERSVVFNYTKEVSDDVFSKDKS